MDHRRRMLVALILGLAGSGCASDGRTLDPPTMPLPAPPATTAPPTTAPELELVTPWVDGAAIPARHTCDGLDVAPSLSWANIPAGTVELAITLTDLDDRGDIGWVLYGLQPGRTAIAEGEVPPGSWLWTNSAGAAAYAGPCPLPGVEHRYQFTLHALNQQLEAADDASAAEVVSMLNLTAIDQSSVSGTYARGG